MTGTTPDSNANVGRNTSDPSGMQNPNEDGGALPPSSGSDPSAKGGWIAFWIVIALVILGGIIWWLVASGDDAQPAGIPSPSATASMSSPSASAAPSPSESPSPSQTPSATTTASGGSELASGDFQPAWPTPVPAFDGALTPLGTGWDYFYQYAASLVRPGCGDTFDQSELGNVGMVQLDGAIQTSVSGPEAAFAFASRMTNTSDQDLAGTVWFGPEVMLIDSNGKIVSVTRVETAPIASPEFGDTPPGAFGPGDSIEVYGQHGPIRQCLAGSDDFANDPPNPGWAPLDSQPVVAPGTYDAVIHVTQPTGDVLGGDADAGTDSQELLYTKLGSVTIAG